MSAITNALNKVLVAPTEANIFSLFDRDGFIRFNMLYVSPIALKHFKEKLQEYNLVSWGFTDSELVFKLEDQIISFKGHLSMTLKGSEESSSKSGPGTQKQNTHEPKAEMGKIFALELDFDPIISSNDGVVFLKDVESFLKMCDTCFFMTYFICIDSEILHNPLSQSVEYLAQRK